MYAFITKETVDILCAICIRNQDCIIQKKKIKTEFVRKHSIFRSLGSPQQFVNKSLHSSNLCKLFLKRR